MRKYALITFICIVLFTLTACGVSGDTPTTVSPDVPTGVENIAPDTSLSIVEFESFQTICEWSNTIVKAKYVGCEPFDGYKSSYAFEVETDFTGIADENIIHIYENPLTSFVVGKSYYLFLTGFRSSLYPNVIYSRVCPDFLLGEIETEDGTAYTFYNDGSFDVGDVTDFTQYIKTEIIEMGHYSTNTRSLIHESVKDAYENAAAIVLVTVQSVETVNPCVAICSYTVDQVLKGEYNETPVSTEELSAEVIEAAGLDGENLPNALAATETEVGDQIILLFRIDPDTGNYDMYSGENFQFPIDSDGGKYILDASSK
ncbi:MAG: hypothetical protein GX642_13600 [Smithella sp.]|nr:hypothetical protein [Smithella sp.]